MAKYYGVKAGKNIGIYKTWDECRKQVLGYKCAEYKSFLKEADARDYVYGAISSRPTSRNYMGISKWALRDWKPIKSLPKIMLIL